MMSKPYAVFFKRFHAHRFMEVDVLCHVHERLPRLTERANVDAAIDMKSVNRFLSL